MLRWRLSVTHTFFSRAIQAASPFSRQSDGERFRRRTGARELHTFHVETTMVIRLNMISDDNNKVLRRTAAKAAKSSKADNRNTRAEFKRLKTILPSIRKKENVSKLDIILEAIKYIDDLTDQLEHRLDEEDVVVDAERSESENIVLAAPDVQREAAAAVMALAAEAQMTSSASGFYSDESPGENRPHYKQIRSIRLGLGVGRPFRHFENPASFPDFPPLSDETDLSDDGDESLMGEDAAEDASPSTTAAATRPRVL